MQMALRRDEGPRTLSRRLREDNEDAAGLISAATGRGLLVGVAACYGTLNVCLKLVYSFPGAPVAGTIGMVRGLMVFACFTPMLVQKGKIKEAIGSAPKDRRVFWLGAAELALCEFQLLSLH